MFYTSLIISLLALALSMLVGRRNPVRSSSLTAGMVLLLVAVPLLGLLPKLEVSWLASGLADGQVQAGSIAEAHGDGGFVHWGAILTSVWLVGCGVLFFRLGLHLVVIGRWCREARLASSGSEMLLMVECAAQLKMARIPELRYSENLSSPVITGLMKPTLLMPLNAKDWSEKTLKMVMMHELGHVQRRDLWVSMAAQIACALHWFNPLVWMLRKRLINECEYACDAHVISHGANAKTYIHALCDVAESCQKEKVQTSALVATLAMADEASLKNRVQNVLIGQPRRNPLMVAGILVVSASVALAYNVLRPERGVNLPQGDQTEEVEVYTVEEVNQRLDANPFPG